MHNRVPFQASHNPELIYDIALKGKFSSGAEV